MKNDSHLRDLTVAPRRATTELHTPLLIAAGLIGVPLAIGLAFHEWDDGSPPAGATPVVDTNTAYPMNHFLPGAGYYHAPYGAWFPMPFNFHDNARGWFRGGQWHPAAQEDDAEKRDEVRTSGFIATGARPGGMGPGVLSSRPTPEAVSRANAGAAASHASIIRGGFGSSARPGVS